MEEHERLSRGRHNAKVPRSEQISSSTESVHKLFGNETERFFIICRQPIWIRISWTTTSTRAVAVRHKNISILATTAKQGATVYAARNARLNYLTARLKPDQGTEFVKSFQCQES